MAGHPQCWQQQQGQCSSANSQLPPIEGYHHVPLSNYHPQPGFQPPVSPNGRPAAGQQWSSHSPSDYNTAHPNRHLSSQYYPSYESAPYQAHQAQPRGAHPAVSSSASSSSASYPQQPPYPPSASSQAPTRRHHQYTHPAGSSYSSGPYPPAGWSGPSVLQTQPPHPNSTNRGTPTSSNGGHTYSYKLDDQDDGADDDDDEASRKWKLRGGKDDGAINLAQKGTSDFVKKLFSMLDDKAYESVVAWSPNGESFIVKDMNDFTKHVLPRNFRHSNFASFVRQLNKYDFHKVKNPEDGGTSVGEHAWEFQHPDFIRGREDLLENVKRKIPAKKKAGKATGEPETRDDSPAIPVAGEAAEKAAESYSELKAQVASLTQVQDQLSGHINGLTKQYQGIIGEMLTFQRNMVQQDQLMQNLIQYLMNLEQDPRGDGQGNLLVNGEEAFMPSDKAIELIGSYEGVAQASFAAMSELSQRVATKGPGAAPAAAGPSAAAAASSSHSSSSSTQASLPTQSGQRSGTSISTAGPLSPRSVASPLEPAGSAKDAGRASTASAKGKEPEGIIFHPPHLDADEANAGMVNAAANSLTNPNLAQLERPGLRVFTVGTLQPREGTEDYLANQAAEGPSSSTKSSLADAIGDAFKRRMSTTRTPTNGEYGLHVPQLEELPTSMPRVDGRTDSISGTPLGDKTPECSTPSDSGPNYLRVRGSTFVPGWAIPPRVLLVDDDAVCRRLSSKFLQVFGCSIDYAVDGMSAVNKMNLEKYDLVLMDIVMPNLDGVSATSLIRQFDPKTPIISMTSNSGPSELMQYMSHGMNDILPKPFTKEGLLNMLEKHLIHLKTVQKMEEVPRSLGLGPVPEGALSSSLDPTFSNTEDGTLNPLAGMGLSDEEYIAMLQNLIAAGSVSDSSGPVTTEGVNRLATGGVKRTASESEEPQTKRNRFTEMS